MLRKLAATGLFLFLAAPLFAQRTTGGLSGTVKDGSGAVLPGATVSVTGPNIVGAQTAITNEQGFYRIINLPPGEYQVSFALTGFKTVNRKGVRVGLGQQIEENASLEVSQLQERSTVVAESAVVDTTSNEVGTNFDRDWVENAPLRRYSFFDLVAAAPGSMQAGGDGFNAQRTHGLRLVLRRELLPARRRRHHRELLQRGSGRAQHGRHRGGRGALPGRARGVRQPHGRGLQHRDPPGHERTSTATSTSSTSRTA